MENRRSERLSLSAYCLSLAIQAATRATCLKKKIGCVLTDDDGHIVATGYNGSPAGMPHCCDGGCLLDENGDCINCCHAEINAIIHAHGRATHMWITDQPCLPCLHAAMAAGIASIVYIRTSNKLDRDLYVSTYYQKMPVSIFNIDDELTSPIERNQIKEAACTLLRSQP